MNKISDYSMLEILQAAEIETAQSGSQTVCRCPVCKSGEPLGKGNHEAQVNDETLYCHCCSKTYTRTEIIESLDLYSALDIKKWEDRPAVPRIKAEPEMDKPVSAVSAIPAMTAGPKTIIKKTVFEHKDIDGKVLYKKERIDFIDGSGKSGKNIFYKEKDKDQPVVFYGLETLQDAADISQIMLVEGEKCVDALRIAIADSEFAINTAVLGLVKASEWEYIGKEAQDIILSKKIIIFQDNDAPGKKNTDELLKYFTKPVTVVDFHDKAKAYDIADWLEEGGTLGEAMKKYSKTVDTLPAPEPEPRFKKIDILAVVNGPKIVIDFVLPGLPKKTVGMIIAPGGTGKSMLSFSIAAGVAAAVNSAGLCGNKKTGKVSIFAAEDPDEIVKLRLQDFWATIPPDKRPLIAENLNIYPIIGQPIDLLDGDKTANDIIDAGQGSRLIMLDTLSRFHTGEENERKDAARVMRSLEKIAIETGSAVIVLHHTSKAAVLNGTGDMAEAGRGSSVFTNEARWIAFLKGMSENEANKHGITKDTAKSFVKFGCAKINYAQAFDEIWLKRGVGGILELAENLNNANFKEKEKEEDEEYEEVSFKK